MRSRLASLAIALAAIALLVVAALGLFSGAAPAGNRAAALEQRLRCPVCRSVSIADSPSTTAAAMRRDVGRQVTAGRTDRQIVDYFRARYGAWVLLDPPASGLTLWLWLLPIFAAAGGAVILIVRMRRSRVRGAGLTPAQREHVALAVERARPDIVDEDEL